MSGAILSGSCSGARVPNATRELADVLNCQSTPVKKCLQQKSIEEIFDGVQKTVGLIAVQLWVIHFGFFFKGPGTNFLCNCQIFAKSNG
jgi:hypothetical protein